MHIVARDRCCVNAYCFNDEMRAHLQYVPLLLKSCSVERRYRRRGGVRSRAALRRIQRSVDVDVDVTIHDADAVAMLLVGR